MLACRYKRELRLFAAVLLLWAAPVANAKNAKGRNESSAAVLWQNPGDIRARNLFWGVGGEKHRPHLPVEFISDAKHGSSPKFDVRDADSNKWTAKIGLEAKPETAASRLLWAIGYAANENYFFDDLQVANMPMTIRKGRGLLGRDGDVLNVRLQRHDSGEKKVGDWSWQRNPFYGTREFNGLRVMMGLIANWDLKDDNNAIFEHKKSEKDDTRNDSARDKSGPAELKLYEVSDVGTAFGTPGKRYTDGQSKGNLAAFRGTALIAHVHKDYIDLNFPKRPPLESLFEFDWAFFFHQVSIGWIGKHIPRSDAKWVGSLLAQLSPDQIRDAFRAAGYSPEETQAYTDAVLARIKELNAL